MRNKFDEQLEVLNNDLISMGALCEDAIACAVKALLNFENLKLAEGGKIVDLDDQLKVIKEENDYLFESDQPAPKIVLGGKGKTKVTDSMVAAARTAAGLPIEE